MALIKKQIFVEAKVGDKIKVESTIFIDGITLYICHIEGDIIYFSNEKNASKYDCDSAYSEYCELI